MIAGRGYPEIKNLALKMGYGKEGTFHTDASDLRKLASCAGVTFAARKQRFTCWENIRHTSVVAINYKKGEENQYWHWVVFMRENSHSYVLDPNPSVKTERSIDFGRMGRNAKWYLPVVSG